MTEHAAPSAMSRVRSAWLIDFIGWTGMLCLLASYGLTSLASLSPRQPAYQILNIVGAIGLTVVSLARRAYQPAVLNLIWTVIAAVALVRMVLGR